MVTTEYGSVVKRNPVPVLAVERDGALLPVKLIILMKQIKSCYHEDFDTAQLNCVLFYFFSRAGQEYGI